MAKNLDNKYKFLYLTILLISDANVKSILDSGDFYKEVYEIVKQIPYGKVSTYGQVAKLAAKPL